MSAYRTAALLLKGVLVLRDTFQQWILSCHGFNVLLELFAGLGDLQGRKEGRRCLVWVMGTSSHCRAALLLIVCLQIHVSLWERKPRSCPWLWCAPSASSGCQGYSPFWGNTHHLPLVLYLLLQLIQFHFQQFLLCHILSHSALKPTETVCA